jgi:hypothetical protein
MHPHMWYKTTNEEGRNMYGLMYQLFNFNGPIAWFVWVPLVVGVLWWKAAQWENRGMQVIVNGLSEANQVHGTAFPTTKKPKGLLMMGDFGRADSECLLFDVEKKKVAITRLSFCSVKDFDYIRDWQLHWTQKTIGGSLITKDPYLLVGTSDLQLPTLKVKAPSVSKGHDWDSQLSILMGRSDLQ